MINFQNFLDTLPVMLYGMLGIFAVIAIIYVTILLLKKIFK